MAAPFSVTGNIDTFFAVLRMVVVAAATVWGLWVPIDEPARVSFFACLAVSAAMGPILYGLILSGKTSAGPVYRFALVVDLVLVYWAVRVTGDTHSSLILGFYLLVALHAFHSGLRIGIAAALSASALLLTLPGGGMWWGDSAMRLGFLQALAIGAGLLSERERVFVRDLLETRRAVEQAQKMVVLGTMGAGIAHEVNNPASSIIARVERVLLEAEERELSAETVKDLEIIRKHALRIGNILQRLLAFARPEGFSSQAMNLNHAIEEMILLVDGRLREKRISLAMNLMREPPLLAGDRTRLEEVILNLFNNAIDASSWGSVIEVGTRVDGPSLEFWVADRGTGIDPKDLPRVFDPFFTTKPAGKGTGLGLYVAWQIVKDHGGTLSLSSEPQRGTSVSVRLPITSDLARTPQDLSAGGSH